jgi:phage head maturation protease
MSKLGRENLYESISNGLVDRMSFGFTIADGGFEYTVDGDGVYHTRITKISKLYDISAIEGFPANDGTEISARSLQKGINDAIEQKRAAQEQAAKDAEAAEKARISRMRRRAKALALQSI